MLIISCLILAFVMLPCPEGEVVSMSEGIKLVAKAIISGIG